MSRYIKLEDAKDAIRIPCENADSKEQKAIAQALYRLDDVPTIDIVHCGECKCCRDELIEEYMPLYIYCEKWNHETDFDDFCSYGERIDNE